MKITKRKKFAFSLTEMTIVLVVVASILSLMTFASSFMQNAKNQAFIQEVTNIRFAVKKFRDTFGYLPGDFCQASIDVSKTLTDGFYLQNTNTSTLNGNCNGTYEAFACSAYGGVCDERYFAFLHLQQSGLIEGKLDYRISSIIPYGSNPGFNLMRSKAFPIATAGFMLNSISSNNNSPAEIYNNPSISNKYNTILTFADCTLQDVNRNCLGGAIKATAMQDIDKKIDDSKPMEGFVYGLNGGTTTNPALCNSYSLFPNTYSQNAQYNNNSGNDCIAAFVLNEY